MSSGKTAGIGVGVILLILVSRGIREFARQSPERERAARQHAAEVARNEQLQDKALQAMDRYHQIQETYSQVEALQNEFGLSDEQFETLLQAEWKAAHPDVAGEPWMVRLGQTGPYWWRQNQQWDIESVRQRSAAAITSSPETASSDDKKSP
jgi:hypothetical protein